MPFPWIPRSQETVIDAPPPPLTAEQVLRRVPPLSPVDTLGKAVQQFRNLQLPMLPVVEHGFLIGWVTEHHLMDWAVTDAEAFDQRVIAEIMEPVSVVVEPATDLEDVFSLLHATRLPLIPVARSGGRYIGCLVRIDLLAAQTHRLTPPRLGGMATPLGVYLTTGTVSGGVGPVGLILAGVVMAILFWIANTLVTVFAYGLFAFTGHPFWRDVLTALLDGTIQNGTPWWVLSVLMVVSTLLMAAFLLLLRIAPRMAGFHAAEHQTVNAVEAGEPLTPEAVARMSRIHPRCGTNLWGLFALSYVAVTVVAMLLSTSFGRQHLDLVVSCVLVCVLGVLLGWRSLGAWLQDRCTTRQATPAELASGIRAGQMVLHRHLVAGNAMPTLRQRICSMGLLQVAIGVTIVSLVQFLVQAPLDGLWHSLIK